MYNLNTYPNLSTDRTVDVVAITAGMIEGVEADQYKELRECR